MSREAQAHGGISAREFWRRSPCFTGPILPQPLFSPQRSFYASSQPNHAGLILAGSQLAYFHCSCLSRPPVARTSSPTSSFTRLLSLILRANSPGLRFPVLLVTCCYFILSLPLRICSRAFSLCAKTPLCGPIASSPPRLSLLSGRAIKRCNAWIAATSHYAAFFPWPCFQSRSRSCLRTGSRRRSVSYCLWVLLWL